MMNQHGTRSVAGWAAVVALLIGGSLALVGSGSPALGQSASTGTGGSDRATVQGPVSPFAEIQQVPQAAASAAQARAQRERALRNVNYAILSLQMDLEQSEGWRAANLELQGAQRDYDRARVRVLGVLERDEGYGRAVAERDAYAMMIEELKRQPDADQQYLVQLARQRMEAGSKVTKMEAAALEADGDFRTAREALVAANEEVSQMRRQMQQSVRSDVQWQQARADLMQARVDVAATAAYLRGSIEARDIAVDFGAYQARQQRFTPVNTGYDYRYGVRWGGSYRSGYPIYWQKP